MVQGVYDAVQNGVTIGNGTQVAAGLLGLGANAAAVKGLKPPVAANELASKRIRFGQLKISPTFRKGYFAGKSIEEIAAGLRSGAIKPSQLPIRTITRDGVTYTMNNRSLMALRKAGMGPTVITDVTGEIKYEKDLTKRLKEMGGQVPEKFTPKIRRGDKR